MRLPVKAVHDMALIALPNRFQIATKCDTVILRQETVEQSENQKCNSECGREVVNIVQEHTMTSSSFHPGPAVTMMSSCALA